MAQKSTLSLKLSSGFDRCFGGVFLVLCLLIVTGGYFVTELYGEAPAVRSQSVGEAILRYAVMLILSVGTVILLILAFRALGSGRSDRPEQPRFHTAVILIGVGIIFVLQLLCGYLLRMQPITDIRSIEEFAFHIAKTGSYACISDGSIGEYILRYQNNLVYLLILSGIYRITFLLTGSISRAPVTLLNTLALNAAVLLTVLTARRLFGGRKAVFTLLLCALFSPFYTYAAYCYTDSLAIPFVAGCVYAFVCAAQSETGRRKGFLFALAGALCCIGFEIKGSVGILAAAAVIWLPLRYGFRGGIKRIAAFLLGFLMIWGAFTAGIKGSGVIDEEASDRYRFPLTHWVMMGVHNDMGAWDKSETAYTESFPSRAEKVEANLEVIRQSVADRGFFGMLLHLSRKAVWSWMDGTYYITNYLEHYTQRSLLHELILYDGALRLPNFGLCCGVQLFLLLSMAFSGLRAGKKREVGITTFLRIAVFGLFVFLLIWETNSRYPFQFAPLYLILATEGAQALSDRIGRHKTE